MQSHSRALFSSSPAMGIKTRKRRKYRREAIWPIIMKGCSTGIPPIQVRIATSAIRVQNRSWVNGRNVKLRCFDVCRKGTAMSTKMDASNASTPPNLLGIDRRMA